MDRFKIYLNGQLLESFPIGFEDFQVRIYRDRTLRGLLVEYPLSLTFIQDGYKILKDEIDANGFCGVFTFGVQELINGTYTNIMAGSVFIQDVEFDYLRNEATTKIADNSYTSLIKHSKDIDVYLQTLTSKNDVFIGALGTVDVDCHTDSGAYTLANRELYKLDELIDHVFDYITDQNLGTNSEWYTEYVNSDISIGVTTGNALRTGSTPEINISLDGIFPVISKLFNLWFFTSDASTTPVFNYEDFDNVYGTTDGITINDPKEFVRAFNDEDMYSEITLGSDGPDAETAYMYGTYTWVKQLYHIVGFCQVTKKLDLSVNAIYDHGTIREILDGSTDYDEDLVFLFFDSSTNQTIRYEEPFAAHLDTQYDDLFNLPLRNDKIIERYKLHNDLRPAETTESYDYNFHAVPLSDQTLNQAAMGSSAVVDFENEIFDNEGEYDSSTSTWAPDSGCLGVSNYQIDVLIELELVANPASDNPAFNFYQTRTGTGTAGEVLIDSISFDSVNDPVGTKKQITASFHYFANCVGGVGGSSDSTIKISYKTFNSTNATVKINFDEPSYFKATQLDLSTRPIEDGEPFSNKSSIISLEERLYADQIKSLIDNPNKRITINRDGQTTKGWLNDVQVSLVTGETSKMEVVTDLNNI